MPIILTILPSGNRALYDVQPQHVPRDDIPGSQDWPRMFGTHIAVELGDAGWCASGRPVTDPKTLELIEQFAK